MKPLQGKQKQASSRKWTTGTDVAKLAGVSKSAVSRAFTGGIVSTDARERIMKAAAELKYRPNHSARTLTTNRSHLIAVAITYLDNQFYPLVVQQLSEKLANKGYRIMLFMTHGEQNMDPLLDEILSYRVDGVILASSSHSAQVAKECKESHIPTIMFNNVDTSEVINGISTDNIHGGKTLASYLIAAGHQKFGIVSGIETSSTSIERCAGFSEALRVAGFPAPKVESGEFMFDNAILATRKLLGRNERPDAIFCINDHMALAALQVARNEFGLTPGQDISIVGFDNVSIGDWPAFNLTSFAQPVDQMIDKTIDFMLAAIETGSEQSTFERVKGQLIIRSSARRAPGIIKDDQGREIWLLPED